jgi:pimeloyl-ACP methyl ester carboxylesterase
MTNDAVSGDAEMIRVTAPDGGVMAVHLLGSGPPLICVPGGPGRASEYLEDLAGVADSRTLLRIDLRGTGYSPLPEDRASLAFTRLADDLEAVRIARGLDRIDVLAHSAGCFVATVYASRHPERISRLVLVTPSAAGYGDTKEEIKAIRASRSGEPWYAEAAALEAELEFVPPDRRQRMDRGLRPFSYARWDERARAHAGATDTQMSLRAMAAFSPSPDELAKLDPADIGKVTAEVLVVVGRLDGLTGVKAGHLVAERYPNARVAELDDAGHYPWVDAPDDFRRTVLDFLGSG